MTRDLPSPELLRKLLRYDPETGKLFWRKRTLDVLRDNKMKSDAACECWNAKYAGLEALYSVASNEYKYGSIFGKKHLAHRVAWAIFYKSWPKGQIDHINGDRKDNRIKNLREVSNRENSKNQKLASNNTSGVCGVAWHKVHKKWIANIMVGGRRKHLGWFADKNDAIACRKSAEIEFGYHKNHGRRREAFTATARLVLDTIEAEAALIAEQRGKTP